MENREADFYRAPGPMTDLASCPDKALAGLPDTPAGLMAIVRGCVVDPATLTQIYKLDVPSGREDERQIRPASDMVTRILELVDAPLTTARPPERRFLGTCRNYATLTAALLRRAGIATRVRAGFAGYFVQEVWMDHWIVEYARDGAWVRVDPELDDMWLAKRSPEMTSEILASSMYLSGSEAWKKCRTREVDPDRFNMGGHWGIGEIRGSVLYDLAALNQDEMLPWDVWGRMEAAYKGETDASYDRLLDEVSEVVIADNFDKIREIYIREPDLTAVLT